MVGSVHRLIKQQDRTLPEDKRVTTGTRKQITQWSSRDKVGPFARSDQDPTGERTRESWNRTENRSSLPQAGQAGQAGHLPLFHLRIVQPLRFLHPQEKSFEWPWLDICSPR